MKYLIFDIIISDRIVTLGTITQINKRSIRIQLDGAEEVIIRPKEFILSNGVKYKQMGLKIAYALSSNKCQGCTFDVINIVPGFFAPNQLYVALSRCKTLENIHILGELKEKDLHVDKKALKMTVA